jgi:hypothetical protein
MANASAEISNMDKVSLHELEPGSPQHQHKKKLIEQEEQRRKNSVVAKEWLEYHHNSQNDKGGKVILKKQMKSGNTHSLFLGRLKRGGLDAAVAHIKRGLKVTIGREHFKHLLKRDSED